MITEFTIFIPEKNISYKIMQTYFTIKKIEAAAAVLIYDQWEVTK